MTPKSASIATSDLTGRIRSALQEDIQEGDLTSGAVLSPKTRAQAKLLARQSGIIAGMWVAQLVCKCVDRKILFEARVRDGGKARKGEILARLQGPAISLLKAERTLLNFLQRLSGIATLTAGFVARTKGTKARILDTRKTTPLWRDLEKCAVRLGGGDNHRMGLYDAVLLKENHIAAAGGIAPAVELAKQRTRRVPDFIEVETRNLREAKQAFVAGVDRIMLDNMPPAALRRAIRWIRSQPPPHPRIEASGGVTLSTVRAIAQTGIDDISVGALTHSPPALDISFLFET